MGKEEWHGIELGQWGQWVAVMSTWIVLTVMELVIGRGRHAYSGITFSFIQNMGTTAVAKESVRNIYTNIAIVGALLMTIAFSMLLIDDTKADTFPILSHLYFGFTIVSMLQCVRAVFESVISLMYTEPLVGTDCMKYLISNPGSMGGPTMGIMMALLSLLLASCVHATMNWSLAAGVGLLSYAIFVIYFLLKLFIQKKAFSPSPSHASAIKWNWVGDETKIVPHEHMFSENQIKTLRSKQALLLNSSDEQIQAMVPF